MKANNYRIIFQGLDALHMVFYGNFDFQWWQEAELKEKKLLAQNNKLEVSYAPINGQLWEMSRCGNREYVYCLSRKGWKIFLLNTRGMKANHIQVKIEVPSSRLRMGLEGLRREVLFPLMGVCSGGTEGVQRVDITVDVIGMSMQEFKNLTVYGYPRKMKSIYSDLKVDEYYSLGKRDEIETVMIGSGPILLRAYNKKKLAIAKEQDWFNSWFGKSYTEVLADYNNDPTQIPEITRFEFQIRTQVLKELNIHYYDALIENLQGVWSYLTQKWMELKIDTPNRKSKRKLQTAPIWEFLREVKFGEEIQLKRKKPISYDSLRNIKQIQGHLSSMLVKEDTRVTGKSIEEWENSIMDIIQSKILKSDSWSWEKFHSGYEQKYNHLRGI